MKKPNKKALKNRCWKLMSEYVRRKDADFGGFVECFTCRKRLPWQEAHAGHYQHNRLDYDLRNLRSQCAGCNTFRGGKLDAYTMRLIDENDVQFVQTLRADADRHLGYTYAELVEIEKDLKAKLAAL